MKPVTFIEGQLPLFGFHDDAPHPVAITTSEISPPQSSLEKSAEDSDLERMMDRYADQGLNYYEARNRAYMAVSVMGEVFSQEDAVEAPATPRQSSQPELHRRSQKRWENIDRRRLTPREKILADRQERDPNLR